MGTPNACPPGSASPGQPCALPSQCRTDGNCRRSGPGAIHVLLAQDVAKQWPDIDLALLTLYKQSQGVAVIQWGAVRSAAAKMYLRACQAIGTPSNPFAHELAWPTEPTNENDMYFLHVDADPKTPYVQKWDMLADLRLFAQRSAYTSWVIRKGPGGDIVAASNG